MKLHINGEEYPLVLDFTMAEARLIYRYSKVTLDKLTEHQHNPDVAAALVHIAFARKHPDIPEADIEKRVGAVELAQLVVEDDDDAGPPAIGSTPTRNEHASEPSISGAGSSNGSDGFPETTQPPTGTLPSVTSAT